MEQAFDKLRSMDDCTEMSTDKVRSTYQQQIATVVGRRTDMTPHSLRTAHALMTYDLLPGKKMSLVGYNSAAYYQRMEVVGLSGPYTPTKEDVGAAAWKLPDGWVAKTKAEQKRVKTIDLMEHRERITASAIRRLVGGTMELAERVIKKNQAAVDEYNDALER